MWKTLPLIEMTGKPPFWPVEKSSNEMLNALAMEAGSLALSNGMRLLMVFTPCELISVVRVYARRTPTVTSLR